MVLDSFENELNKRIAKAAEELEAHRKNNPPSNYVTKEQTRAAI
jgi:hypothetical protein